MIINKSETFTTLQTFSKNGGKDIITIFAFFEEFNENYTNFKSENLILDFSNNINTSLKEILLFSQKSEEHKKNNKSFVIVCNGIKFDELPNNLIAVPTFKEAVDIIDIEDIERDLGI